MLLRTPFLNYIPDPSNVFRTTLIKSPINLNSNVFTMTVGLWMKFSEIYSKTCVRRSLSKRPKIGFQDQLSLNAGLKFCRMLQGECLSLIASNGISS